MALGPLPAHQTCIITSNTQRARRPPPLLLPATYTVLPAVVVLVWHRGGHWIQDNGRKQLLPATLGLGIHT
jgi:hypothetical protein